MKRFMIIFLLALICSVVSAAESEKVATGPVHGKSIFSIDVGVATDGKANHGYSVFIKTASFLGEGPVYYGFGSLCGSFLTAKEVFFETGVFMGYHDRMETMGLDYDVFVDLILTGGRIAQESAIYRKEAPALHLGLSLGLPSSSDIDGALTFAPVIRPYDIQTGEWNLSRSYLTAGLALRFKSYREIKKLSWSDSFGSTIKKENNE